MFFGFESENCSRFAILGVVVLWRNRMSFFGVSRQPNTFRNDQRFVAINVITCQIPWNILVFFFSVTEKCDHNSAEIFHTVLLLLSNASVQFDRQFVNRSHFVRSLRSVSFPFRKNIFCTVKWDPIELVLLFLAWTSEMCLWGQNRRERKKKSKRECYFDFTARPMENCVFFETSDELNRSYCMLVDSLTMRWNMNKQWTCHFVSHRCSSLFYFSISRFHFLLHRCNGLAFFMYQFFVLLAFVIEFSIFEM